MFSISLGLLSVRVKSKFGFTISVGIILGLVSGWVNLYFNSSVWIWSQFGFSLNLGLVSVCR